MPGLNFGSVTVTRPWSAGVSVTVVSTVPPLPHDDVTGQHEAVARHYDPVQDRGVLSRTGTRSTLPRVVDESRSTVTEAEVATPGLVPGAVAVTVTVIAAPASAGTSV